MSQELDSIDVKLLDCMQRDASLSTSDLAERVGLSQSPCWRRVQRLKESGYVKNVVAVLDRERLGLDLQVFALVKTTTNSESERAALIQAINATPEILGCWAVFGDMDMMLQIVAPDMKWFQNFILSKVLRFPGVIDVKSVVTLSELKCVTALPLRPSKYL